MKVSIIVPVYNTSKYLHACVDSILAQTYSDLDVVLVDDGSTDDSGKICDDYARADRRVSVIHQPNQGLSAARNAGVDKAVGEYIIFVDSDDTVNTKMTAHLLGLLEKYEVSAALGAFTQIGEEELTTKGKHVIYTPEKAIEATLYQNGLNCSVCGKLFPAQAVKATKQDVGRYYEDLSVFYKIYENIQGEIVATDAPLYYYRKNPDSILSRFTPKRLDVLKITEEIENRYSDKPHLRKAAKDRRFSANFNMMVLCARAGMKDESEECWRLVKKYRLSEIFNPHVRAKNVMGALLSYLGRGTTLKVAEWIKYS